MKVDAVPSATVNNICLPRNSCSRTSSSEARRGVEAPRNREDDKDFEPTVLHSNNRVERTTHEVDPVTLRDHGASTRYWSSLLGESTRTRMDDTNNLIVGSLKIGVQIGRGGFARVFEATDQKSRRRCAVKVLKKKAMIRRGEEFHAFMNELQILKRIDHPNVVSFHGCLHEYKHVYIVMNLAYKDLRSYANEGGSKGLPCKVLKEALIGILEGLNHLHRNGICHLDIKTENILVAQKVRGRMLLSERIQLCDLGFGEFGPAESPIWVHQFRGTLGFFAPEMFLLSVKKNRHRIKGRKADMFSVGVVLMELSLGQLPVAWDAAYISQTYPCRSPGLFRHHRICEAVSTFQKKPPRTRIFSNNRFRNLINRLLSLDPEKRPSAENALDHMWLCQHEISHPLLA